MLISIRSRGWWTADLRRIRRGFGTLPGSVALPERILSLPQKRNKEGLNWEMPEQLAGLHRCADRRYSECGQPVGQSELDEVRCRMNAELARDVGLVKLYRFHRNVELLGNLLCRPTLRQQN